MTETELTYPADLINVDNLVDADTRLLLDLARTGEISEADRLAREIRKREFGLYRDDAFLDIVAGDTLLRAGESRAAIARYDNAVFRTDLLINPRLRYASLAGHYGLGLADLLRANVWTMVCELRSAAAIAQDLRYCGHAGLERLAETILPRIEAMRRDARVIASRNGAHAEPVPT